MVIRKQKKQSQKGSTLVEVIVAMAVAVIISTIAFSVCDMAIAVGNSNRIKNFFCVEAQNYVSAYYLGGTEYLAAMRLLTGYNYTFGEDATIYYSSDLKITESESAKYIVHVTFGENFLVECENENLKLIYQIEA